MFFLTLSVFAFNRALACGGAAMTGLSVAAIVLSIFSKYSLWPMLSVLVVLFVVRLKDGGSNLVMRRGTLIFLLSGLLAGGLLLYKYEVVSEQIRLLLEYQRPGLKKWTEGFASTFLFQTHPFITAGALYSLYVAVKERDYKYLIIAWLLALMLFMQVRRIRYLVPIFPMLALMAAYGVRRINAEGARRFLVLVVVFTSVALAAFAYLPFLKGFGVRNLKDAGAYLDSLDVEEVNVFTLPQKSAVNPAVAVPLLDLFTNRELAYEYESVVLPEKFRESPLRFTWHYRNPRYYAPSDIAVGRAAVAVISGSADDALPEHVRQAVSGRRAVKVFKASRELFRFSTIVTVYQKEP
jgi:hypothetical protein